MWDVRESARLAPDRDTVMDGGRSVRDWRTLFGLILPMTFTAWMRTGKRRRRRLVSRKSGIEVIIAVVEVDDVGEGGGGESGVERWS